MHSPNISFALGLATAGILAVPAAAHALSFTPLPGFTDATFQQLTGNGTFNELFVAESRFGNNGPTGDFELDVNPGNGTPVAQGQRTWVNGGPVNFTLAFTGSQVIYTVGGQSLTANFSGAVTEIYIRGRAEDNSSVGLTNLEINTVVGGPFQASAGAGATSINYWKISDVSSPFTLAGTSAFSWELDGNLPTGSKLAYQIKVGGTPVPTPALLPGLIGLGLGIWRKRQADQAKEA